MSEVIQIKNLSKKFRLFHSPLERLLGFFPLSKARFEEHIALENISFSVNKGEFVSIIGRNGSGKSTLLKIICGVLRATSGSFKTKGKVVSLLELGTGFNPDMSGRENIINSARVMGFDISKIKSQITIIEEFADLAEYFDMPVRTYSSGMYVRLAMSLFLHLEPEIFIIDEALSVGDIFFVQKCFSKIEEMRKRKVTFLFVSHDINTVQNMSDRVIFINNGSLIYFGDKQEACRRYYETYSKSRPDNKVEHEVVVSEDEDEDSNNNLLNHKVPIISSSDLSINSVTIMNDDSRHSQSVQLMEQLLFRVNISCLIDIQSLYFGLIFKNKYGQMVNTSMHQLQFSHVLLELTVPFALEPGEYTFDIVIGRQDANNLNTGETLVKYIDFGPVTVNFDYSSQLAPFFGQSYLNILSQQYRQIH